MARFRIIDYTNATRLLDPKWDKPPSAPAEGADLGPQRSVLSGTVRLAESGDLLVGATIALMVGPNDQRGPVLTDERGCYRFDGLPGTTISLVASGPRLARRQFQVEVMPDDVTVFDVELRPAAETKSERIEVKGLEVTIADEATFVVTGMQEPMSLEQYLDYSRGKVVGFVPDWNKLRAIWQESDQRAVFLEQLESASVHVDVLAQVLEQPQADQFDLLAHLAYGRPLQTRCDRAAQFRRREQNWLAEQQAEAREVLLALIAKYELGGLQEMTNPTIFRVSPFREMGEARGVLRRFGGDVQQFRQAMAELQRRLYAA